MFGLNYYNIVLQNILISNVGVTIYCFTHNSAMMAVIVEPSVVLKGMLTAVETHLC